ncbi:hypothetical protein EOD42_15750 [Rhodovarius crocodyli]|uniref:Organic solvent tolerance-like N-terminal domain-containing protein n=1 Tax=Rhodovarius crocodyli TaxID=1979269 RepID=A0A437MDC5_9PROT|nr:LptA/OstA family protein [Rhodovarius crocodyli]RVT95652.1 hypothetical protein EOD42_15750 [Rhodovarius crocodyli]
MNRLPIALCLGLLATPALAQNIDLSRGGPVDVTATDGIEWRQEQRVVVARGNARAIRDGVTVDAARLLARYRPQSGTPAPAPAAGSPADSPLSGGNEIWRLEAEGNVRIFTETDTATGDRAVYDIDQAVLVLTGRELTLTTPQQRITSRDSLEYWSQRRLAVARGNAVVITQDGRHIGADTLVAYLEPDGTPQPARPAAARPGQPAQPGAAAPPPGAGRIDRVELFGNVEIRTETEVVRGDRGVYQASTGLARILGNVRITRGDNQVNGEEAITNLNTGVSRLIGQSGQRVRGTIQPQQGGAGGTNPLAPAPSAAPRSTR